MGMVQKAGQERTTFSPRGARAERRWRAGQRWGGLWLLSAAARCGATAFLLAAVCSLYAPAWAFQQTDPAAASAMQAALAALNRGNVEQAISILKPKVRQGPGDPKLVNLLGIALTSAGKLEEADSYFSAVLKDFPAFYPALKNRAINEVRLRQNARARSDLNAALRLNPSDLAVHLTLAELDFSDGKYSSALVHYHASRGLYLRDPGAIIDYAKTCATLNQKQQAGQALAQLPESASPLVHFQAGEIYARMERFSAAAGQFKSAYNSDPAYYDAGYNLVLALINARDYTGAIASAQEIIASGQGKAEVYSLLSEAYENSGKTLEAYNALREATLRDPQDENSYLDLVALSVDHMNYELALRVADAGLSHLPYSYRLRLARGAVYAMKGQFDQSMADLQAASHLQPGSNLPYFAESMALMQLDRMDESIRILRQRIKQDPNDYLMLYALGEALHRDGAPRGSPQEQEAIDALERSVRLRPDFARSRAILGTLLNTHGDTAQAVYQLETALKLDPQDLTPCFQLAQAYRRQGKTQKARRALARFEKFKATERQSKNHTLITILREDNH
jgi:tetratricopeptide (TPR) repeat protein